MGNLKKVKKLAEKSFLNGLRLHKDSMFLFKNESYPTSYALSILAQEEIGKSFLMSEIVFQNTDGHSLSKEETDLIIKCMLSHTVKQGWFSREVGDYFKNRRGKVLSKMYREVSSGKLEENKQNSLYVGLSKVSKKINFKTARVVEPTKRIKAQQARLHITRVNDFIIELVEGCRRGVTMIDIEEVDNLLTLDLVTELETCWPMKSKTSESIINRYRKLEIDLDN